MGTRVFPFVLVALLVITLGLDAGGGKKVDPKDKDKPAGAVEIYKAKSGFRYRVKDADGKTIAIPTTNLHWEKKEDCLKAIEQLKSTLNKVKPTEVKD